MKLQLVFLSLLVASSTSFAQAPTNGLVAYYPFNGNANDASGNNNNGVRYGTINTVDDHNGIPNGAFQFTDGSKIRIANSPSLKFTTSFSYSGWVRLRSLAGRDGNTGAPTNEGIHTIFSKNCDYNGLFSMIGPSNSKSLNFTTGNWNNGFLSYFLDYTFTNWVHVAATYDSNTYILSEYVNGKIVTGSRSIVDFTASNSVDLIIGGMDCWSYFFNGDIDELRFYNRALTEKEIIDTYEYEKAPITSINYGSWEDTSVWSCNCVPTQTDVVRVKHAISVSAKSTAYAWNVQYSDNGKITLGSNARLILSKQSN